MTQDQHNRIIEKLAYLSSEMLTYFGVQKDSEYNWRKAIEMAENELRVNGEKFLLSLLKDKTNE